MVSVQKWIALLSEQVGRGIYVWSGNGQALDRMTDPEAWIEKRETSEENAARAVSLYRIRKAAGIAPIRAFDCSGLMHWGLKSLHILERDVSSRTLYAKCTPLSGESELTAGDFVFRHDGKRIVHVGAYVGSGRVIECAGRDVGVVSGKLRKGYWNRFGRLEGAFSDDDAKASPHVRIKGKSVRIRSGGSTAFPTVQIAHAGEAYPLLGAAETGWYRIDLGARDGFVTNRSRYTEVTYNA